MKIETRSNFIFFTFSLNYSEFDIELTGDNDIRTLISTYLVQNSKDYQLKNEYYQFFANTNNIDFINTWLSNSKDCFKLNIEDKTKESISIKSTPFVESFSINGNFINKITVCVELDDEILSKNKSYKEITDNIKNKLNLTNTKCNITYNILIAHSGNIVISFDILIKHKAPISLIDIMDIKENFRIKIKQSETETLINAEQRCKISEF